jgi:hypothetical protein
MTKDAIKPAWYKYSKATQAAHHFVRTDWISARGTKGKPNYKKGYQNRCDSGTGFPLWTTYNGATLAIHNRDIEVIDWKGGEVEALVAFQQAARLVAENEVTRDEHNVNIAEAAEMVKAVWLEASK